MNPEPNDIADRVRAQTNLLPERLRELDAFELYRILLLDATGGDIPPVLMNSREMLALEAEGLMHEVVRESHHVGISIEQFHGYRGDPQATELLNRIRLAVGVEPVPPRR